MVLTYLGNTAYLANHVAHTSAASSGRPTSAVLEEGVGGVGCVSTVQLAVVSDADDMKGDVKLLA